MYIFSSQFWKFYVFSNIHQLQILLSITKMIYVSIHTRISLRFVRHMVTQICHECFSPLDYRWLISAFLFLTRMNLNSFKDCENVTPSLEDFSQVFAKNWPSLGQSLSPSPSPFSDFKDLEFRSRSKMSWYILSNLPSKFIRALSQIFLYQAIILGFSKKFDDCIYILTYAKKL